MVDETVPGVRVVRGTPDDIELVALVAGLASTTAADPHDDTAEPVAAWGRDRGIRGARPFGTHDDAWRWSSRG